MPELREEIYRQKNEFEKKLKELPQELTADNIQIHIIEKAQAINEKVKMVVKGQNGQMELCKFFRSWADSLSEEI